VAPPAVELAATVVASAELDAEVDSELVDVMPGDEAEDREFDPLEALAADDLVDSTLEADDAELKSELNPEDNLLDSLLPELGPLVEALELLRLDDVALTMKKASLVLKSVGN
jgi:hypothetical protein